MDIPAWFTPVHALALTSQYRRRDAFERLATIGNPRKLVNAQALAAAEIECARLRQEGVRTLVYGLPDFPPLLAEIPDPPLVIYARGNLNALLQPCVAIVGARKCTSVGRTLAKTFSGLLADRQLTIVSGLAHGIDTAAHLGALEVGAPTVAVLGAGLGRIYPSGNTALAERIVANDGILLSEYAWLTSPRKHHFPERNRLVSGLSVGTLVVEAGERSGSLITARLSLEQGRDVWVVPGAVNSPVSAGCHRLLREGAPIVYSKESLLQELGLAPDHGVQPDDNPHPVMRYVGSEPVTASDLAERMQLPVEQVLVQLTELELEGFVQLNSDGYSRRPS